MLLEGNSVIQSKLFLAIDSNTDYRKTYWLETVFLHSQIQLRPESIEPFSIEKFLEVIKNANFGKGDVEGHYDSEKEK